MPVEMLALRKALGLKRVVSGAMTTYRGRIGDEPVVGIVSGMGTALARRGVEDLLASMAVDRIVVVGITGALDPDTKTGSVVVPSDVVDAASGKIYKPFALPGTRPAGTLWTSDQLVTNPDAVGALRERGVVALDMETAAVAAVSEAHDIPWSVVRAVSDRATDGLLDDDVLRLVGLDGSPDWAEVTRFAARHPFRMVALSQLALGAKKAARAAAAAAVAACRAR